MNIRIPALCLCLTCFFITCFRANAALVTVKINTPDDELLPDTVVAFEPLEQVVDKGNAVPGDLDPAKVSAGVMEQRNRQFAPHILAVQRGAEVTFPNLDDIKHHVYSFSEAKVFELQLYKGQETSPVKFDKYGIVELGCNVHDWMLGYIYVVDTPWFAQTTNQNSVSINLPEGRYRMKIWHSRFKSADAAKSTTVEVSSDMTLSFDLSESLLPGIIDLDDEIDEFSTY